MAEKTANRVRFWYGVFLGIYTVVIGILFIVGASEIYFADPEGQPYSYELVGEKLFNILIPVIIWIVAVVAGYVLSIVFPVAERRLVNKDKRTALNRLKKRIPNGEGEEFLAERKKFKNYELTRIIIWSVCAAFGVVAAIMCIVYLADAAHFPAKEITAEMVEMLRGVLPWIGCAFALFISATVYDWFSAKRELDSAKKLLVLGRGYSVEVSPLQTKVNAVTAVMGSEKTIWIIRGIIFTVAVVFIILGALNGGMTDVLIKAVKICTECIGLG